MGDTQGQAPALTATVWLDPEVLKSANRHAFFEIMRSLRQAGLNDLALHEKIRIRPNLSLAFPDTDIESISLDEEGIYHIEANFFGLYGVASPLPTFYTEDLIQESMQGGSAMRDFIDILHCALYPLLYQSWEKYKIWLCITEHKDSLRLQQLFSLIGLRDQSSWHQEATLLLPYAGNLSVVPRSAMGLEALLQGILEHEKITVNTCIEQIALIPQEAKTYLGQQAHQLGEDSLLGVQIRDCLGKIEIEIKGLDAYAFTSLLLGTARYALMQRLLAWYSPKTLCCELLLWLDTNQKPPLSLSQNWNQLGLNTWLGAEHLSSITPQPVRFLLSTGEQNYASH